MSLKFDPELIRAVQEAYEKLVSPDDNGLTSYSRCTDNEIAARHELYKKEKEAEEVLQRRRKEADPKDKINNQGEGDKFVRFYCLKEKEALYVAKAKREEDKVNTDNFKFILRDQ